MEHVDTPVPALVAQPAAGEGLFVPAAGGPAGPAHPRALCRTALAVRAGAGQAREAPCQALTTICCFWSRSRTRPWPLPG